MKRHFRNRSRRGHIWAGAFLLAIGGLLLTRALGMPYPVWLFSWPVLLIAIGLFIGVRHGFRLGGWIIPIVVGSIFLAERFISGDSLTPFIAPIIVIIVGILFIIRPRHRHFRDRWRNSSGNEYPSRLETEELPYDSDSVEDKRDFIDTTAIFGGVKKIVLSKNFKGGEINNFMGGSEIHLTQADFSGRIRIEATNIFGGTKLVVPSTWDVQSEVVAIFGGVDDKRNLNGLTVDTNKLLILEGTCIFGGIEIHNF